MSTEQPSEEALFRNDPEFSSFRQSLIGYRDRYNVNLKILVWGPGETANADWWAKRADLIEKLRENNPADEIATSEELFRQDGDPPIDVGHYELHHAEVADVILALVLASPREQGGVYRELEIISHDQRLRDKTHIFLPSNSKAYLTRFSAGMLNAYRNSQKYLYPWSVLKTCVKVTARSLQIVEEERNQRMYSRREIDLRT